MLVAMLDAAAEAVNLAAVSAPDLADSPSISVACP